MQGGTAQGYRGDEDREDVSDSAQVICSLPNYDDVPNDSADRVSQSESNSNSSVVLSRLYSQPK